MAKQIKVSFWGVRGSLASCGRSTARLGGNSACLSIEYANHLIVCDAGTGISKLSSYLKTRKKTVKISILLSHMHLGHLIGLPYFDPLYNKANDILLVGPSHNGRPLKEVLGNIFCQPQFPVSLKSFSAKIKYKSSDGRKFKIGEISVEPFECYHPGGSLGWKFVFPDKRRVVVVPDNEPSLRNRDRMLEWMSGADLIVHDAQLSPAMYAKGRGCGHSPYTYPVQMAISAEAKSLYLYHYDPHVKDQEIEGWLKDARRIVRKYRADLKVSLAAEGRQVLL